MGDGWLDEREARAWRALQLMHLQLDGALARQLGDSSDLSLQDYGILVALTGQPCDRMRAYELARLIAWDKSRLSHHLKRMIARGLVTKESCPTDRRGFDIAVTPAGRRAIEAAAPGHVEAVRRLFLDHVGGDELDVLANVSERVIAALGCTGDGDTPGA